MRGSEMHKKYFRVKNLFINRALASAEIHLTCRKWFKLVENGSNYLSVLVLQFVKTILSQGHLTPLPLYVSPVYWAYDYSLRVYPLPDMLVIADKYDPFTVTNTDCLCINPVRLPYALPK